MNPVFNHLGAISMIFDEVKKQNTEKDIMVHLLAIKDIFDAQEKKAKEMDKELKLLDILYDGVTSGVQERDAMQEQLDRAKNAVIRAQQAEIASLKNEVFKLRTGAAN